MNRQLKERILTILSCLVVVLLCLSSDVKGQEGIPEKYIFFMYGSAANLAFIEINATGDAYAHSKKAEDMAHIDMITSQEVNSLKEAGINASLKVAGPMWVISEGIQSKYICEKIYVTKDRSITLLKLKKIESAPYPMPVGTPHIFFTFVQLPKSQDWKYVPVTNEDRKFVLNTVRSDYNRTASLPDRSATAAILPLEDSLNMFKLEVRGKRFILVVQYDTYEESEWNTKLNIVFMKRGETGWKRVSSGSTDEDMLVPQLDFDGDGIPEVKSFYGYRGLGLWKIVPEFMLLSQCCSA